ncbi:MAG: OprD family outer membrane porin [Thermodesulfobacteriota bacterium]
MKTKELNKNAWKLTALIALVCAALVIGGQPAFSDETGLIPESLNDVFAKGKLNGVIKTLYYQRMFNGDTPDWATLAIGGNLNYGTAPLYGFTAGVGFKTSQGDYANTGDEVYRGLLATGATPGDDESYAALDEYFLRYSNWDTKFTLGAHAVNTPWLNGHDIRMTPKKYRGLGVINNSIENLELHGYYLTDWLDWTAEDWTSMTSAFTGDAGDDEGALALGAKWQILPALSVQGWDYYFRDVMNSLYLTAVYQQAMGSDYTFGADLRYLNQMDVGDKLAGNLGTYTAGGSAFLGGFGAKLTLYFGANGSDNLVAPFGESKIISLQVLALDRAEENAYTVKFDYDFAYLGVDGLSLYALFSSFDTPDSGGNASSDATEIDVDLQYKLSGWFDNCSIRLRHAIIDKDEDVAGGEDFSDSRVYLVYKF